MRPLALITVCAVAAVFAHGQTPAVRVVETTNPTADIVLAAEVLSPPEDPTADAAPVIQAAIDRVAAAKGGTVFLTVGRYRLASPLVIKETATVRGDWLAPPAVDPARLTVLMPVHGRGEADGTPAITIERGGGIREITVWYPEQSVDDIAPYPWTLRASETVSGDNYTVTNVTLVNAYQGFKVGPEGNELHTLRNVYGTCFQTGVWVDTCTDIGRITDLHISPVYWETSSFEGSPVSDEARKKVRDYLMANATGIDMGRSDWEYLYGLDIEGYGVGLKFREGAHGRTNAVLFGASFRDCRTALVLERLNDVGLAATGCYFGATETPLLAPETFDTVSEFNTCDFDGTAGTAVQLNGTGILTFQNCIFRGALNAESGSISALGCEFAREGQGVRLAANVQRARLLGNVFSGETAITNEAASADVMIAEQNFSFRRPNVERPPDYEYPKPPSRELFVVTDYGASPDLEDNTAAFQKALDAARPSGGTVYVPGGYYRFSGELVVPSEVELRGCFDVPHHTVSGGSVLMPTGGKGQEDGAPFILLESGSGLRGLTLWWPDQTVLAPVTYPWGVRALGPKCWLLDVTLGNAYQGVDFWTHPSEGHIINYLAGAFLRRGLFVSKSDSSGWVEDLQFNPHYSLRLPKDLPHTATEGEISKVIDYQREHLEAMVFGRCYNEHITRTFLYAAYDGIAFRDDGGGPNARIIMHGTDTGSRGALLSAAGEAGLEFINAQLVPLGNWQVAAIVAEEGFAGEAAFFNSQMWAGDASAIIKGQGNILIQQLNTVSGAMMLAGGNVRVENTVFHRALDPHIDVQAGVKQAELIANIHKNGPLNVNRAEGAKCDVLASSASGPPPQGVEAVRLAAGWEADDAESLLNTVTDRGAGQQGVSQTACDVSEADAHTGARALRIAGTAENTEHSHVYFKLFDTALLVNPDTTLSYWIKPTNELSREVGIDLLFTDGSTLRDSPARNVHGPVHPSSARGKVGEWTEQRIDIGRWHANKVIDLIMLGFDANTTGAFETFIDDLSISSSETVDAVHVAAEPASGTYAAPVQVTIESPGNSVVRYILDGTNPTAESAAYEGGITLDQPGLHELRYSVQLPSGELSKRIFARLYEVK